jgi:A nuclease of the HNH/ENDO VII superfamily with conserved WHH
VLTQECLLKNIGEKFSNLNDKLTSPTFTKEARSRFLTDMADASDNLLSLLNDPSKNAFKAWEKLSEITTDARKWVSKSEKVIEKLQGRTDAYIDKVKGYYNSHSITGNHPDPPFLHPVSLVNKKGQTLNISVQYDDFGHPDFRDHVPKLPNNNAANPNHVVYRPATPSGNIPDSPVKTLTGEGADMAAANKWAKDDLGLGKDVFEGLPNGKCKIKDFNSPFADSDGWVECTWHHHEDGRTMIPVPSELHGKSGAPHTGGKSVIGNNIQDFFASPTF